MTKREQEHRVFKVEEKEREGETESKMLNSCILHQKDHKGMKINEEDG